MDMNTNKLPILNFVKYFFPDLIKVNKVDENNGRDNHCIITTANIVIIF